MSSNKDEVASARERLHQELGEPEQPSLVEALDLDAILDTDTEGWNPEAGAKLIGRVLVVGECDCGGFGAHPLIEVLTDDGKAVAVHGFHEVLRNAIRRNNPVPGNTIGIKYLGKAEGRGSFEGYEEYRMVVQR